MTNAEFGILGHYNNELGDSPFERFFVGGDGMASFQLDGRETIALRGMKTVVYHQLREEQFTINSKWNLDIQSL